MAPRLEKFNGSFFLKLMTAVGLSLLFAIGLWGVVILRFSPGFHWRILLLAVISLCITGAVLSVFVRRFAKRPLQQLIDGTVKLARGDYDAGIALSQSDELATLAEAINDMGRAIGEKEAALNKQRDEYRRLFEMVPCFITVQDRDFRLVSYNRQFEDNFHPKPGDFCYCAYKGRTERCNPCPVEQTFVDGRSHYSEETAVQKDGTIRHWIVRTAPVKNSQGEIVAAMEMNLDVTHTKILQDALEQSEKKYYDIFENIPNPVFVLDMDSLEILDCNGCVAPVYGWSKAEMTGRPFTDLFKASDRSFVRDEIRGGRAMNKIRQVGKTGRELYANIRVSPSRYPDRKVFLVTTSDITHWMETEQQLIQAGKMATLGEMATGVAHELNQPLSVIKTASSFFMKKIGRKEAIPEETLETLAVEIDGHVDRATKIINHMRQFGRKSEGDLRPVLVSDVLKSAFELFSQQLKLREIEVRWEIEDGLSPILADHGRLEQVLINLMINARDAVEQRWAGATALEPGKKRITLAAASRADEVLVEVRDTGGGVPTAIADKIFEPFFTTKTVGEGTGLGLSISYGIVKEFGGSIEVDSEAGGGACFRLVFPVADRVEGK
jgi:histidine kinase